MGQVETKFSVGETVFHAGCTTERRQHSCPDCKGSKTWKAISPAGGEYDISCPRCSRSFSSDRGLSLDYSAFTPAIRSLTIGQVRAETTGTVTKCQYMCRETGVGGGTLYDEDKFFHTRDEAQRAAEIECAERNSTYSPYVDQFKGSLEISDYQLSDAKIKLAQDQASAARSMVWNIEELMDAVDEADDFDAAKEAVDDYRRWSMSRDQEKAGFKKREAA